MWCCSSSSQCKNSSRSAHLAETDHGLSMVRQGPGVQWAGRECGAWRLATRLCFPQAGCPGRSLGSSARVQRLSRCLS
eukprot:13370477-Alexandrium_andersonii.AAC.1